MLVGGAALLGAIGLVSIGAIQGINNFNAQKPNLNKSNCCDDIEKKVHKLQDDFDDEKEDQDRLEMKQHGLCRLVRIFN